MKKFLKIITILLVILIVLTSCSNSIREEQDYNDDYISDIPEIDESIMDLNLEVVSLTDNEIKVKVVSKNNQKNKLELYIDSTSLNDKREVEIGEIITFKNLDIDTIYDITLKNDELVLEELSLKTFKNTGQEIELFYLIDATNTSEQELKVDIFGYTNTPDDLLLDRSSLQFIDKPPIIKEERTYFDNNIDFNYNNEIEVYIKNSDFFKISYIIDKSLPNRGVGYLDEHYLMTTIDQMLIMPNQKLNNYFWNGEVDMTIDGHFNILPFWEYNLSFTVENNIINFLKDIPRSYLQSSQIFGFHDYHFNINDKNIEGTDLKVISEKSLGSAYDIVFQVYEYFTELWGDKPSYNIDDKYTVMLVDDTREIYAGEHDSHQGYAYNHYEEYSNMLPHQIYHRWQGWDRGIEWNWEQEDHGGFWVEGFTDYYSWKVYEDLGYIEGSNPGYDWYESIRGTEKDIPLLEYKDNEHDWRIIYTKGAIFAYALDKEIQKLSNGDHSLDDLLKYSWQKYQEEEYQINYEFILDYLIKDLGIPEIESWWQKYLINNDPVYIEEWE